MAENREPAREYDGDDKLEGDTPTALEGASLMMTAE
jgi:hypothetical protein